MNGQIFISYRREDASYPAGRLYDNLQSRFPQNEIFIDVDSIKPGIDFVKTIEERVGACHVLVAVIGKRWLSAADEEGRRRLDNPDDFVRVEVGTALKRGVRVIPVLVEGASMPPVSQLPEDLKPLARRNALSVSHDRFRADSERLIDSVEEVLEAARFVSEQRESGRRQIESNKPLEAERYRLEEQDRSSHVFRSLPSLPVAPPTSPDKGRRRLLVGVLTLLTLVIGLAVGVALYLGLSRPSATPAPVAAAIPRRARTGTLGTAFPVYVASLGNSEIVKLDTDGNQTVFSSGGNLSGPDGLAFDASGNLYVANQCNNAIVKLDANGDQTVFSSGGNLNGLNGLAFDAMGNLYVASFRNHEIVKIDADGNQTVFSSGGSLNAPNGLAFDPSGNLYVADTYSTAIIKLDANGNQTVFSLNNARHGMNLKGPAGLAFDARGNLYVASYFNNAIIKLDANGNQTVFSSSGNLSRPNGLAFDASGNLYVANQGNHAIIKLDANGNQTVFRSNNAPQETNLSSPGFLAFTSNPTTSGTERLAEAKRFVDAKDYIRALPPLQKAADAGNGDAMNQLGELYYHGRGVDHDYTRAREWYEKGRD